MAKYGLSFWSDLLDRWEFASPVSKMWSPKFAIFLLVLVVGHCKPQKRANFENDEAERSKRRAWKDTSYYWTSRVIPYQIANTYTAAEVALIKSSMRELEKKTCLNFREKTPSDKDYVEISDKKGCWADQGRVGGKQEISLGDGCLEKSTILHEIGHMLGMSHEHQHPERAKVVNIIEANVKPSGLKEIEKLKADDHNYYGIDFDLDSIMMYSSHAYAAGAARTILTKDPSLQHRLDKYTKFLSYSDVAVINLMLKCKDLCGKDISCPKDGFVDKNCECITPKSYFSSQCKDRGSDEYCLDQLVEERCDKPQVAEQCKRTCDMCPMYHVHRKTWTGGCENKYWLDEKCKKWAQAGHCNKAEYKKYMAEWCAKSCHSCGTNPDCLDADDCAENYYQSDCQQGAEYYPYVLENCKTFCGFANC